MIDRFERFSFSIFEISRFWHKIAGEVMDEYGLKGPCAIYLSVLYRNSQGLTAARLAELCGRDKADVSRSVAAMEEKGLLIRENKPYRAQLYLTEKGKEAAGAVCRRVTVAVEHAGKGYTVAQRKVFYQVLETVTQNLSELCKDGIPEK